MNYKFINSDKGDEWKTFGSTNKAFYYSNGVAHLTYMSSEMCDEFEISYSTN